MLLKKLDVKKYKALTALQSHLEEREELGKTEVVSQNVVPMVQQYKIQVKIIYKSTFDMDDGSKRDLSKFV